MADNHTIRNIYHMLAYAFEALRKDDWDTLAAEDFEHIHDLLAAILVYGIPIQIKQGLHRDYLRQEGGIAGVRGQILISETLRQQPLQRGRLVCAYDEFVTDTPHNRILKTTMLLLLWHGSVNAVRKQMLRKLLLYFAEVHEIAPAAIRWTALKYHRNNASYRLLLGICQLVIEDLLLTTEKGTHRLANYFSAKAMHWIYERFVRNYYRAEHTDLKVSAMHVKWDTTTPSRYLPAMKTDVTLEKNGKRLIIDTKYYYHTMQTNEKYMSTTFISHNLYQIYAYVKNCDTHRTGNVAGVLLYAMTDEAITPNEDMMIAGSRISVKTLDLGQDWSEIRRQLDQLCSWF